MQISLLADFPVRLDRDSLLQEAHLEPDSAEAVEFDALLARARDVARPKVLYGEAFIAGRSDAGVVVEHVEFRSRVMSANLRDVERLFPYIMTCGHELDELELDAGDFLQEFWLDIIKAQALWQSVKEFDRILRQGYRLEKTAAMSPGSGEATVWPIEQQRELFSLFGDVRSRVGVDLTDSFLMIPNKSISGIRFATTRDYQNCQLCRRENCPSRRAPFDADKWHELHGMV